MSNDFPAFEIDSAMADPKFLGYLTQSRWFVTKCEDPSRGITNRQRMPETSLLSLEVPLPPLPEQRRIVRIIESVATRIAEARRLRESIEAEREEMLRSCAREMAKGARRRPLQQVAPVTRRPVNIEKTAMYPELGIRSFGKGTFHKPPISGADLGRKRLFHIHPGDLVFSNVFSWEGAIAVVQEADAGRVGSHRYITCVPDPNLATAEFLRCWLLTDEGMAHILEASPGAAGRNRTLGLKKLMAIPVPLPPLEEQKKLTRLSTLAAAARDTQTAVATELEDIMPSLLDRAFRGEL